MAGFRFDFVFVNHCYAKDYTPRIAFMRQFPASPGIYAQL
jgi:hypothetical protein